MKKVVCQQCGLVNLDKFVSFPHCAACGALLPQQAPSRLREFWRRPVRPFYWMLAVGSGLGMLGLAIASIARETKASGDKPLLVYAAVPRTAARGQIVKARFTLDSAQENPDSQFRNISLRLGRETQREFVNIAVQPAPDAVEKRGRGLYYQWDEMPRNSVIQLALTPRAGAPEVLQLKAALWAAQYQQFEVRATIETAATDAKSGAKPMQTPAKVAR